jgi:hypothetical protein
VLVLLGRLLLLLLLLCLFLFSFNFVVLNMCVQKPSFMVVEKFMLTFGMNWM